MISFIIPAYNEERCLAATLEAIHAAARSLALDYEIVVANDASTDATANVAGQNGARVVNVQCRQISRTRNAGAAAALGERFIFVDADTLVTADVVGAAIAALDAGAVGGGAASRFDAQAPGYARRMMKVVVFVMRLCNFAAGCFVYARRDAFEAVGGFDERHFAAEEIMLSLALRKQGRFVILREAVTTSSRKFVGRSRWDTLRELLRLIAMGLRGVRSRDTTAFWYDGRR